MEDPAGSPSVCQGQGGFPRTNPPFPGGCAVKSPKPADFADKLAGLAETQLVGC
jgi:hypothetical protein